MDYPIYEIYEGCKDDLTQLIDILKDIRNKNNGAELGIITHRGNIEVIDDDGNTICEINI